jgi:hypothetical protein
MAGNETIVVKNQQVLMQQGNVNMRNKFAVAASIE